MPEKLPRAWRQKGFVPFRLEILTPVHIGSGTQLSPLEYVIRQKGDSYALYNIDLQGWLMNHGRETEVRGAIESGDVGRIRRMLNEKVDADLFAASSSPIPDKSLARELLQAYGGVGGGGGFKQKDKTGDVDAALRNPANGSLYIPGSSLKGALSTPLINWLDQLAISRNRPSLRNIMEQDKRGRIDRGLTEMFGRINEHAMQALKVSDCLAPPTSCTIVRARERSRNPEQKGTPKNPCEAIMPGKGDLWGRIMLDSASTPPAISLPDGQRVDLSCLAKLCNEFYGKRFVDEIMKFYQEPHLRKVGERLVPLLQTIGTLGETQILLRIGHYSHVECVTVDNNKPFTSKGKDRKPKPYGTTRTLANDMLPFGWVMLHFCTLEEYEQGIQQVEKAERAVANERSERRRALQKEAEEKARKLEEQRREREEKLEAERMKAEEEERKKKELVIRMAQLTPEEARILQLEENGDENMSMQLFKDMQGWSPEMQAKCAKALKACWERLGKWSGKQSDKQKAKIARIKELLGK